MLSGNPKHHRLTIFCSALLIAACESRSPAPASAETWTNLQGTGSIEAVMIGLWEDGVILKLPDGTRRTVPLNKLRGDSRIQAQNLAKQLAAKRAQRIKELKQQSEAANSAAPEKLPVPPAAPKYSPPEKDASIGDFIDQVNQALAGGHLRVLYDCRPLSYRQNIDQIIKLAANHTSPATWRAVVGVPHRLGELIVTRQNWLLGSPRFVNFSPADREKSKWTLLGLGNVLHYGLSSDAIQLETFQTGDFDSWLDSWDNLVAPYVAEMIKKSGIDLGAETRVVSTAEGTALISIGSADSAVEVTMVSVEGFWVPQSTAETWNSDVEQAKKRIEEAPPGTFASSEATVAGMIGLMLEPLAAADSAGEYHQALDAMLSQPDSAAKFQQVLDFILSPIQAIMSSTSSPGGTAIDAAAENIKLGGDDERAEE